MTLFSQSYTTVSNLPTGVGCAPKGAWFGYSGSAGFAQIFPSTSAKGWLKWTCVDNVGDYGITCVNASFGQASTLTIPDPGAASANFTLDTGIVSAGVGSNSPGSLTGVSDTLKIVRNGQTYYIPLYAVNA